MLDAAGISGLVDDVDRDDSCVNSELRPTLEENSECESIVTLGQRSKSILIGIPLHPLDLFHVECISPDHSNPRSGHNGAHLFY
jgi:hypothetical protein